MSREIKRKGPERALIFELSPVVSSRNQLPKDMVHSVPRNRSMTSSFSLWRSKVKLLLKISKVLKYYKKPMGLNLKQSKISLITIRPSKHSTQTVPEEMCHKKDGPPNGFPNNMEAHTVGFDPTSSQGFTEI